MGVTTEKRYTCDRCFNSLAVSWHHMPHETSETGRIPRGWVVVHSPIRKVGWLLCARCDMLRGL